MHSALLVTVGQTRVWVWDLANRTILHEIPRAPWGGRLGELVPFVAEGAETHEQITFLKEHDCQQVQGFYYSPAIPLQQMPLFVEKLRQKRNESVFSQAPPKGEC